MILLQCVILCASTLRLTLASQQEFTELRMPQVQAEKGETYLCHALPLDSSRSHWITGFEPHSNMKTAHHMLLFGCAEPGSDADVWECGEMQGGGDSNQYRHASVCNQGSKQEIVYAWARDAPALTLPDGVGFKVAGDGHTQYLVLQVHYMHPTAHPDSSGITLVSTDQPMPRRAQTMLLATDGLIKAQSTDDFEVACVIDEPVEMHPFAYRVHAHARGKVVSGWKVTQGEDGLHVWQLIGKQDPMEPEMFYPVANSTSTIVNGDIVAARCHMRNEETHDIHIGATGEDEMCNFYMMYWVDGDGVLDDNQCQSEGPPKYYWREQGGLSNIPDEAASTL
jgi:peptidylglycine monooxygenase